MCRVALGYVRALEQHLVVRAALRVGLGRSRDPLRELDEALDWLRDPERLAPTVRGVAHRFLEGTAQEPALEHALEALANAFAAHAGRCVHPARTLDFTVTLDDDVFDPSAQSPLRPGRSDGSPASAPDWAWMRRLQVRDGDVATLHRFAFPVRVALDPRARG